MKKKTITAAAPAPDYRLTAEKINDIIANAPDYRQQALYEGSADQTAWERSFPVTLVESQWNFLITLLQDKVKQQKQLIDKTRKYPSDTIASSLTRERKEAIINQCEVIANNIPF
jgi:hypothetical protein